MDKFLYCGVLVLLTMKLNVAVYLPPNSDTLSRDMCSNFPDGLKIESQYGDVGDRRWANQCKEQEMMTAMWFQQQQTIIEDVKCCHGNVNQVLSHPVLDFHYFDQGNSDAAQQWQVECKPNHVVTAIHLTKNPINGYATHINAMKCSLLVGSIVDSQVCMRLVNSDNKGGTRLANETWQSQCPLGMAITGMFDDKSFKTVKYTKCCLLQDYQLSLPLNCEFTNGDLCQWTQDIDDDLDWKYQGANGGSYHYLSMDINESGGIARISSPGLAPVVGGVCFQLNYFVSGYAPRIDVLLRYADNRFGTQNITTLKSLTGPLGRPNNVDLFIDTKAPFQIIIEGTKNRNHVSLINILAFKILSGDNCKVDACSPPSIGCSANSHCIRQKGYFRCLCQNGYRMTATGCVSTSLTTPPITYPTTTTLPITVSTTSGNNGKDGGESEITAPLIITGKTINGNGNIPNPGKHPKVKASDGDNKLTSWMNRGFGGAAGVLLTALAILLILAYRRRLLKQRQRVVFDMELLHRRPISEPNSPNTIKRNNNKSLLSVPDRKVATWNCRNFRSTSIGSAVSLPETNIAPSSPQTHHYFEVEPASSEEPKRKVSQGVLVSPVYGNEEQNSEGLVNDADMFFEPPSDEKELRAQLKREISRQCIRITDKTLGQGAFGYVKLGTWKRGCGSIMKVAVKMLKEPATSKDRIMFFKEAVIMSQFSHANVIYMYGVMATEYPPMIILEYMSFGNLKKYLLKQDKSRNGTSLITRDLQCAFLRFARDIVAGMTYLSNLKFVHRDLAARNILLNANLTCKIGDFGLARDLIGSDHYTSHERTFPVKWTAPEAIQYRRFSSASDVWSFGIVLYEIWSLGRKPYKDLDNRTVTDLVCNRRFRLPPPQLCPRIIYHIMIDCWHPEPSKRPTFSQLKYCLTQSDNRLLGKTERSRRRSTTLTDFSLAPIENEDVYGDLQFTYCRTE